MSKLKEDPYGNYKVYHPEGGLMFFCDFKKYNWYLSRNLAHVIGEKSIKLNFIPRGYGEDSEFLTEGRKNRCVVSGETDGLTKHHVIPTQYRKYFPTKYKSNNSNDVVILTREIHDKYELTADIYKKHLEDYYITESEIFYNKCVSSYNKIKGTIEYKDSIPSNRLFELYRELNIVMSELGIDISHSSRMELIDLNELIVNRMGVEKMIVDWKHHFIENTDPQFLPKWWNPNYVKIVKENK